MSGGGSESSLTTWGEREAEWFDGCCIINQSCYLHEHLCLGAPLCWLLHTPSCLHEYSSGAKVISRRRASWPGLGAPHTVSLTDSWGGHMWGSTMNPRTLGYLSQRNEVLNGDPLSSIFTKSCSGWGKRSFHYRGINWTSEILTGPRQVSCQGHESWKDKIMHFPLQGEEKTCSPCSFISKLSTWQLSEFIKLSFNFN